MKQIYNTLTNSYALNESHALTRVKYMTYLLLANVLLCLLLFHSKFIVHLLPSFTDIFSFAQLVYMCQSLSRLSFRFSKDVFDFGIILKTIRTNKECKSNVTAG